MEGRESIEATPRPTIKNRKDLENVGRPDSAEPTSDKTTHTRQAEIYRKVIENKEPIMNRLSTSSTFDIFEKVREIVEAKKEKEKENSKDDKEEKEDDKDEKKSKKSDKEDTDDENDISKIKGGKTEVDVEPETKKPVVDGEDMEDGKKKKMKKEEVEVIDELSKDTIQSYKDKQREVKKDESPRKSFNRLVGAARAERKLAKEELSGNQHKIDVAAPKGKITSADFKKLRKEEVEELDELSKNTLGSYVKKASHDVATKSAATGRYAERSNREEDNRKKTGDYSGYRQGRKDNETADKMFNKSWKRRQGIAKAVDKITKEEVENVYEGSKDKYRNYIKKATDSADDIESSLDDHGGRKNKVTKNLDRKLSNRLSGVRKASMKLYGSKGIKVPATEEIENVDEKVNAYAVGMAQAQKSTGDTPPLKKSTITKAHKIAKAVEKNEDFSEAELAHIDSVIEGYGDKAQKNQSRKDALKNLKGQESQKAKENAMKQQDIDTQKKKEEILKQRQQRTALNQSYELETHTAMIEAVKKSISDIAKNPAGPFTDAVKGVKSSDAGQTYITDTKKVK
jgi:hypothetical protein